MAYEKLIEVSDTEFPTPESGKFWISSLSGQAYIFLNGHWTPFAAGEPGGIGYDIVNPMIILGGSNISDLVEKGSININNVITSEVDRAEFILQDTTSDGRYKPNEGCNVTIFKGDIADGVPEKVFGGNLMSAPQTQLAIHKYKYNCNCLDYSKRLNNELVLESFTNKTAGYIIKYLVSKYMPEFTIANVQDGDTIDYISFNYKLLGECIKQIAELTSYEWYVDYEKDIHFFTGYKFCTI